MYVDNKRVLLVILMAAATAVKRVVSLLFVGSLSKCCTGKKLLSHDRQLPALSNTF